MEGEKDEKGKKSERKKKTNEDRIVNGYQLDSGQPWYAGLGFDRDPRYLKIEMFVDQKSESKLDLQGRGNYKKWLL